MTIPSLCGLSGGTSRLCLLSFVTCSALPFLCLSLSPTETCFPHFHPHWHCLCLCAMFAEPVLQFIASLPSSMSSILDKGYIMIFSPAASFTPFAFALCDQGLHSALCSISSVGLPMQLTLSLLCPYIGLLPSVRMCFYLFIYFN